MSILGVGSSPGRSFGMLTKPKSDSAEETTGTLAADTQQKKDKEKMMEVTGQLAFSNCNLYTNSAAGGNKLDIAA